MNPIKSDASQDSIDALIDQLNHERTQKIDAWLRTCFTIRYPAIVSLSDSGQHYAVSVLLRQQGYMLKHHHDGSISLTKDNHVISTLQSPGFYRYAPTRTPHLFV